MIRAPIGLVLAAFSLFSPPALTAGPSEPEDLLREELARLIHESERPEIARGLGAERVAAIGEQALQVERLLDVGNWLGSLRPLAELVRVVEREVRSEGIASAAEDMDAVDELGAAFREGFESRPSPLAGKERRPAALQALLEDAHGRARGFLTSASRQGHETRLEAGVYYLASAMTEARLAELLTAIPTSETHATVEVPGLDDLLLRLEEELVDLYRPPLSQERHATFIRLSSTLKLARELRDSQLVLGAVEHALDVRRGLSLFGAPEDSPPLEASDRERLEKRLAGIVARIGASDASLANVYVARARALMADDGGADDGSDGLVARVLVEDVLPEYLACLERKQQTQSAESATVTVTLVRWPFT